MGHFCESLDSWYLPVIELFAGSGFYYWLGVAARPATRELPRLVAHLRSEIVADGKKEAGAPCIGAADHPERGISLAEVNLDGAPG